MTQISADFRLKTAESYLTQNLYIYESIPHISKLHKCYLCGFWEVQLHKQQCGGKLPTQTNSIKITYNRCYEI